MTLRRDSDFLSVKYRVLSQSELSILWDVYRRHSAKAPLSLTLTVSRLTQPGERVTMIEG